VCEICCWTSSSDPKCIPLSRVLIVGNRKKSHRAESGEQGEISSERSVFAKKIASPVYYSMRQ
jgi:hypothetical protein